MGPHFCPAWNARPCSNARPPLSDLVHERERHQAHQCPPAGKDERHSQTRPDARPAATDAMLNDKREAPTECDVQVAFARLNE